MLDSDKHRASRGAIGLLLLYLVFTPPLFLLGPFALLLLLSRPASWREWAWLGAAGVGLAVWLAVGTRGQLLPQVLRGSSMFFTGAFVVMALWRPEKPLRLATIAALLTVAASGAWARFLGIGSAEVIATSHQQLLALYGELLANDPELLAAMTEVVPAIARLLPGLFFLLALAGGVLAWRMYHWVATQPMGVRASPFGTFRFNDHMIWGALATLALALAPVGEPWRLVSANALLVWAALYAFRGLAVMWGPIQRASVLSRLLLLFATVVLLPFAAGGLLAIGLADTWIDVRSKLSPPSAP